MEHACGAQRGYHAVMMRRRNCTGRPFTNAVGFKYIGQLIREDKIALGGEESADSPFAATFQRKMASSPACSSRNACRRGASIGEQFRAIFKKLGREFWPVRENLHLSDEQKANAVKKVAVDASTLVGRKVVSIDRTDGAKFVFDDGSGCCCVYPGPSRCCASTWKPRARKLPRNCARGHQMGAAKLKETDAKEKSSRF